ncbi:hypothetical protein Tco_0216017 [Tanacetum coccineum]
MTNTCSGMTPAAIEEMINQHVDAALEARRVNQDLELENGNDNGGDGNGDGNGCKGNGTGQWKQWRATTMTGTEGVVGLIRWSEKMETVFYIATVRRDIKAIEVMNEVLLPMRNDDPKDGIFRLVEFVPVKNNDMALTPPKVQETLPLIVYPKWFRWEEDRVVTVKENKDESKEKRLEDVPTVRDFP